MHIIIPTYRRDSQVTWSYLSKDARARTVFVVDERDKRRIYLMLRLEDTSFWVVPETVTTIAEKRAWIIEESVRRGIDKILMLDDDLRFAVRKDWNETKLTQATTADVDVVLAQVEELLTDFAHVGIGPRQGNNTHGPNGNTKFKKMEIEPNDRMMYALGYRTDILIKNCILNRVSLREDFDYNLQLLRKGFENRVIHTTVTDQKYNTMGGCHDQRTVEMSNEQASLLASLHPGLVKVVEKDYDVSTKRLEVIVQWKRALGAG